MRHMIKKLNKASLVPEAIHQNISVELSSDTYFTTGVFNFKNSLLAKIIAGNDTQPKQVLVLVDEEVLQTKNRFLWQITKYNELYQDKLTFIGRPLVVPKEEARNYKQWLVHVHKAIESVKLHHECFIVAIGGKNILDLTDYIIAKTYRQINLIRIPSMLLAPNYSNIEVKDEKSSIQKINAFKLPYAVINDFTFITNQYERDWHWSIVEAIRIALMVDAEFFEFLRTHTQALVHREKSVTQQVVHSYAKSCIADLVNKNHRFAIQAASFLNFGEGSARKLMELTRNKLSRGEALAIGIALDSTYSYLLGMLSRLEWQKVLNTLTAFSFEVYVPEMTKHIDELKQYYDQMYSMNLENNQLSLVLPQHIGKGVEVQGINLPLYTQAIMMLQKFVDNQKKLVSSADKSFKLQSLEFQASNSALA